MSPFSMSRTFVEDNGCERPSSAAQRVYVNNMNTLQATTSLPERTPYSLLERNTEAPGSSTVNYVGSRLEPISSPRDGRGRHGAAGGLQQSRPTQRAFAASGSPVEQQRGAEPITANGEVVHANLQGVYNRIMRRLQRQLNYAEVSRASLAEQYGVDLQMACEEDQREVTAANTAPQRSTRHRCRTSPSRQPTSTPSSPIHPVPGESEANTVRRPNPRLFTGCHVSTSTTKAPEYDSPGPRGEVPISARAGGRCPSRLIQFKVDASSRTPGAVGSIAAPAAMGMSDASGAAAPAVEEESRLERDIAAQPCPLPLRLVIQHVLDTLQKKMSLAEGGSLKDCIVFSFESRALLDRLLKEIPLYSQYSTSQDTATVAGAAQQDMALVYQKLRQKPVLLPRAGYVEDPVTGAIHGQILGGGAAQSESVRALAAVATPTAAVSLPAIVNASRSFNPGGAAPPGAFTVGTGAMSDVQLPSGYGKSSRLNDATLQGGAAAGYGDPQHQHQLLRDHMRGGSGADGGSSASISDAVSAQNSVTAMMESAVASVAPPPAFEAAHRATRLVSVGTVTEENNLTTVPKADYAALQQRLEALEVQLADAQMHRSALADQLCEELQYTEKKKRVLQYLRETLVRECTMLRSQLRLASGRVQMLQQQQHSPPQSLRGVMVSSGVNDTHNEGPNASVFGGTTRMHKQLGASTVSPMTLSLSADVHGQQHRQYLQRPLTHRMSFSESIGSVYGGTSGCGRGRLAAMQRHASGGCTSLGASLSAAPPGVGVPAAGISSTVVGSCVATGVTADGQQPNDLEAVQSLLDLVLLAVEEDAVLPSHTLQMVRSAQADIEAVTKSFSKDEKRQLDELRNKYDERQYAVKKNMIMRTAEHNYLIEEQKHEVQRLQALTDTTRVRAILQQHVSDLRTELQQMRMYITEQIHFFKTVMQNTAQSLLRRSVLADKTLSENLILTNVVSASREMVESAGALLMPMLTNEYRCGYHPWPLKLRNTTDPLAHIIHLRYGAGEVIRLRDSLNIFAQLYGALHRYISREIVLPDSTRPSAGKPLQHLCAALALNPMSHTEVVFAVRHAYDTEMQLCKRLARYNLRLMWNAYLQRVYTNRSVAALAEAFLNPRLAALPVAGRINVLAKERAALLQERVKVQRERAENAKSTYRLWQEKEIDIMEGYPTPQTQRNRLALLTGDAAGGSNAMGVDVGGNALGGTLQGHLNMATMGRSSRTLGRATTDRSEGAGALAI